MMTSGPVISRRILLKWAGIGGAAAFAAGCTSATPPTATTAPKPAATTAGAPPAPTTAAPAAATEVPKVAPAPKSVSISFSTGGTPDEFKMFDIIMDMFQKKYPTIKVERNYDPGETWDKVHNKIRAGTSEDLLRTNDDDVFFLSSTGVLMILDDYVKRDLKRDDYVPSTWTARNAPGREQGCVRYGGQTNCYYYNKAHFDEAGLKAPTDWVKDNWTLDDFETAVRKLARQTGGKVERYGAAIATCIGFTWLPNAKIAPWNDNETASTVNNPEIVALFDRLQKWWVKDKIAVPVGEDALALFNAGKLPIYYAGIATSPRLSKDINWGLMPVPKYKADPSICHMDDRTFSIPNKTKYPEETWQLAKFLLQEDAQWVFAKANYIVPGLKKVSESQEYAAMAPKDRKIWLQAQDNAWRLPDNPMGETYAQTMCREDPELRTGAKDAKTFLDEKAKRLTEASVAAKWDSKQFNVPGWRLPGIPANFGRPGSVSSSPY